jgi:ABC-type multidrug transport system ATPase subunit
MFDDPLSALDAHVGQHVFEQAIMKMLVQRGRTVVLVTHQLQYLPKADNVIVMKDGRAVICSSPREVENTKSDNVKRALTITRQQSIERELHHQVGTGYGGYKFPHCSLYSRHHGVQVLDMLLFCFQEEEDEAEVVQDRHHTVEEEIEEAGEEEEENEKGKLMTKEEREKGAVALKVYLSYASACGYLYVIVALALAVVAQGNTPYYFVPKG